MAVTLSPVFVGLLSVIVLVASTVHGIAGFAVVGTMALATQTVPATTVVFMIVPILSVNVLLVSDLSPSELRTCSRQFVPLILAALVGTIVGMAVLDRGPVEPLRISLGLLSLAFVVTVQKAVPIPGLSRVKEGCFVERPLAMVGIGGTSGLLFGGTDVGVQLIAYVRSYDLSHDLFVGVVAMIFLGLNAVRVATAGVLGLYPNSAVVLASVGAAVPAIVGIAVGKRLRDHTGGTTAPDSGSRVTYHHRHSTRTRRSWDRVRKSWSDVRIRYLKPRPRCP